MEKRGQVRLLTEDDKNKKNGFGYPIVGWKSTSQGKGGLFNPRGYAFLRVVVQSNKDGKVSDLYDQPIIVENPGSFIVIQDDKKRIAFVENFRMTGERSNEYNLSDYVKHLDDNSQWGKMLEKLGEINLEIPRGISLGEGKTPEEIFLATAYSEALQEAGIELKNAKIVGKMNANSTFFAHSQAVILANVKTISQTEHDDYEIIGSLKFLSTSELRRLIKTGKMVDACSLAALMVAGIQL